MKDREKVTEKLTVEIKRKTRISGETDIGDKNGGLTQKTRLMTLEEALDKCTDIYLSDIALSGFLRTARPGHDRVLCTRVSECLSQNPRIDCLPADLPYIDLIVASFWWALRVRQRHGRSYSYP